MARALSKKRWLRKQPNGLVWLRILDVVGLGLAIACVLATLSFVLLEAGHYVLRK